MQGENNDKKNTERERELIWLEEEISLLLHVIMDYTGTKFAQGDCEGQLNLLQGSSF